MSLSSYRIAPRVGHLQRVRRVIGFLSKMRHAALRIRTEEPDFSSYDAPKHDWMTTVYGEVREEIPKDAPEPLGQFVTTSHYADASLLFDLLSGKAVTGTMHFFNQTLVDWSTKKQATVETATYGSEFIAARTCTDQVVELRNLLRYLGVPIREQSYMFGDNQSVVNSSMLEQTDIKHGKPVGIDTPCFVTDTIFFRCFVHQLHRSWSGTLEDKPSNIGEILLGL